MNPAQPRTGTVLCRLDDLDDPGAKGFRFQEGDLQFAGFVVRRGEAVFGYIDSCPHAGWPLAVADRYLTRDKALILCSGHGALFGIEDGACVVGPCVGARLLGWPVHVRGDEVVAGGPMPESR